MSNEKWKMVLAIAAEFDSSVGAEASIGLLLYASHGNPGLPKWP
jgi:hypothetical protein